MLKPDAVRLAVACLAWPLLAGCPARVEDSHAFRAACHGDRLGTTERRNAAIEAGYAVHRQFDCIELSSFTEAVERKAREAAARTPEAIARRDAEWARDEAERRARFSAARGAASDAPVPPTPVARLEANSAPESIMAAVKDIGPEVAAQIVEARHRQAFRDWPDLVTRVPGLRAARTAVLASWAGLTVDGQALQGAAPPAGYLP